MRKVRLTNLNVFNDRHGNERIYVREKGYKPIAITAPRDTPEFMRQYSAALESLAAQKKTPAPIGPAPIRGTFNELILIYYGSTRFTRDLTTDRARNEAKRESERIREKWGDKQLMHLKKADVRMWMDEITREATLKAEGEPRGHGSANNMLSHLNLLLNVALAYDRPHMNPTAGIEALKGGTYRAYTDEEVAAFTERWKIGKRERMIFDLAYCTGQRRGDQWRMTRDHFKLGKGLMGIAPNPGMLDEETVLKLTQEKTGVRIRMPAPPRLITSIKAIKTPALVGRIDTGETVQMREYSDIFAAAVDKAGLPSDCVLHGLRYTCCRVMAEAGCTDHEIMSVSGHQTLAMVQKYTKDVNRPKLAASAVGKVVLWEEANRLRLVKDAA